MLELIVNGVSLDLPEGFVLDMEFNNPLFADDEIQGDYSLSASLQWTDTNIKAFNFVKLIDAVEMLGADYDAIIRFGNVMLPGKVVVEDCTDRNVNFRFKTNLGNFKNLIDKKLGVFGYENTRQSFLDAGQPLGYKQIAAINDILVNELDESTSQYTDGLRWIPVPVYTPTMGDGDTWGDTVNFYRAVTNVWPNEYFNPVGIPENATWWSWFVFFPTVKYILQQICKESGYVLKDEVFDDELSRLLLFSNYLNYMSYRPQEPLTVDVRDNTVFLNRTMPDVESTVFVKELCKLLCSMAVINEGRKTVRFVQKKNVLSSREYIDWTALAVPGYRMLKNDYSGLKLEYKFGSFDEYAESEFEDFDISAAAASVATFSALAAAGGQVGTIRFVEDERAFYQKKDLTTWEFYSHPFQYKNYDGGGKTVSLNMCPMFMYKGVDKYAEALLGVAAQREWLVPKIKGAGYAYAYTLGEYNEASKLVDELRVFFYRGLRLGSNGRNYPLGASEEFDFNGNVVGSYSLGLNGDRGIGEMFYKDYAAFRSRSKPIEMNFRLNFEQLTGLDTIWANMIRVNEINYRVSRIRARFYKYHIGISEALLYTA